MSKNIEVDGVWIGLMNLPVWQEKTNVTRHDGGVAFIENPELEPLKGPLVDKILRKNKEQRAKEPLKSLAEGGMKVRNLEDLGLPIFDLINARAKVFFKVITGSKTAVVDDCWANVMHQGEWLIPHAHKRSTLSVVYSLEPGNGEEVSDEPLNGHLMLTDPRLPQCCPLEPNLVNGFFRPIGDLPAMMVLFPSYITHMVAPYQGTRPRITIAWNINDKKISGEVTHDFGFLKRSEALEKN